MDQTIKPMNACQKLSKARVQLQSANLTKSGQNAFSKYSYFQLQDFLPTLNKINMENGLTTQFSIIDNVASLRIINADNPEDVLEFSSPIAEAPIKGSLPIQSLGAVHTYMKRYLYLNAYEIVEFDAVEAYREQEDAKVQEVKPQPKPQVQKPSIPTFKDSTPYDEQDWLFMTSLNQKQQASICQKFKVTMVTDLSHEQIQWIKEQFKNANN